MQHRRRRWSSYAYYLRSIVRLLRGFRHPLAIVRIFSPMAPSGTTTVELRTERVRFRVRGATDVWSIKETWLDRFYERYGFALRLEWTVVDIGAGVGEFTLRAAQSCSRVVAFEPSPESFALLRENMTLNNARNVQHVEAAISGESGSIMLDTNTDPLMSKSGTDLDGGMPVRALSLGDAMRETGIDHIDLLKIDCEGEEYDILRHAGDDVLSRVHRIVMEYHDLDAEHEHSGLARFLESAGYAVETFPNPVHSWTGFLRAQRPSPGAR